MLNIPLAVVGLLGIATALPHAPEAQLVAKSVIPDDILQAMAVDRSTFPSFQTGGLIRSNATVDPTLATRDGLEKRCTNGVSAVGGCCAAGAAYTTGDIDNGGWGVLITNGNTAEWAGFYFYENDCDSVVCDSPFCQKRTNNSSSPSDTPGLRLVTPTTLLYPTTSRAA